MFILPWTLFMPFKWVCTRYILKVPENRPHFLCENLPETDSSQKRSCRTSAYKNQRRTPLPCPQCIAKTSCTQNPPSSPCPQCIAKTSCTQNPPSLEWFVSLLILSRFCTWKKYDKIKYVYLSPYLNGTWHTLRFYSQPPQCIPKTSWACHV